MINKNKFVCKRCGYKKYTTRTKVIVKYESTLHGFISQTADLHTGFATLCNDCAKVIQQNDELPWLTGLGEPTAIFVCHAITEQNISLFWTENHKMNSLIDQYIDRTDYDQIKDDLISDIISLMCDYFGYDYNDRFDLEEAYNSLTGGDNWNSTIVQSSNEAIEEIKEKQAEMKTYEKIKRQRKSDTDSESVT